MDSFLGSLDAPVYFINHRDPAHPPGYVMLAPYTEFRTPPGYSRETARTLADIDSLQRKLQEQEVRAAENDFFREQSIVAPKEQSVRDRMYARMVSSATTPYEREFISEWLKLRDEKKRKKYAEIFTQRNMFLYAREMDAAPNRAADDEKVNLDRIHF